jgi:hypothetical protein
MTSQELAGTTALVTGASRGFGRGIAVALARAGRAGRGGCARRCPSGGTARPARRQLDGRHRRRGRPGGRRPPSRRVPAPGAGAQRWGVPGSSPTTPPPSRSGRRSASGSCRCCRSSPRPPVWAPPLRRPTPPGRASTSPPTLMASARPSPRNKRARPSPAWQQVLTATRAHTCSPPPVSARCRIERGELGCSRYLPLRP